MVTSASKVAELLHCECEEVLDIAKEKMQMKSDAAFEAQFVKYLSVSALRTTVRDKYFNGELDNELMGWDRSSTLPLSAKKLLDAVKGEINKNIESRVAAANKLVAIKEMEKYSQVRLDSVRGACHSLYCV